MKYNSFSDDIKRFMIKKNTIFYRSDRARPVVLACIAFTLIIQNPVHCTQNTSEDIIKYIRKKQNKHKTRTTLVLISYKWALS